MYEKNQLSDDDIMNVSGGMEIPRQSSKSESAVNEDPMSYGRCRCGGFLRKIQDGYQCKSCNMLYDKNKNPRF